MAYYSVNLTNRTVTIHKETCKVAQNAIKDTDIKNAVYGVKKGQVQVWFNEEHFNLDKVKILLNNRDYGKIFCSNCF